ncbi:MAG: hypothetical protein K6B75_04725 [Lachnospiraceae bacterium]|nr:hypothetical protein [Lachnospiraceae bacterium]
MGITEQIAYITKNYKIGRKPLSKILGWGETTIIRYMDGISPNEGFAKKLNVIYKDPWEYLRLLEENKNLITDIAFKKSRRAVFAVILSDVSLWAVNYLAGVSKMDAAPYMIVATLHYANVYSLCKNNKPIFDGEKIAGIYKSSPKEEEKNCFYPELLCLLKKKGIGSFYTAGYDNGEFLPDKDICGILMEVYSMLNAFAPNAVRTVIRRDKTAVLKSLKNPKGNDKQTITDDVLKDFYFERFEKQGVDSPQNIKNYIRHEITAASKRTNNGNNSNNLGL